jgi:hypothetical protein
LSFDKHKKARFSINGEDWTVNYHTQTSSGSTCDKLYRYLYKTNYNSCKEIIILGSSGWDELTNAIRVKKEMKHAASIDNYRLKIFDPEEFISFFQKIKNNNQETTDVD